MSVGRENLLEQIDGALARVDLAAPSTTKYHRLEVIVAELTRVERGRVVAATITRAQNFVTRATQSARAQSAQLFIGVVTDQSELEGMRLAASASVRSGMTSAVLLVARGAGGRWMPVWAGEGTTTESTALTRLAAALQISVERIELESPRLIDVKDIYDRAPEQFRKVVEVDPTAADIVAIAHRRQVVERFDRMLHDDDYFDAVRAGAGGRTEAIWQQFLEQNPWILGIGLAGQLLTSWDDRRLEQVVAGFSVASEGKRADALLRTNGSIRSLVFAEIKHHRTDLLGRNEYRSGCWPPSPELAGAAAQVQQTIELASRQIGSALADVDADGADTGEDTFLLRPRSFLILGHLGQLRGAGGGVHRPRLRSFELYRRNLYEPEILTFDELLARAEWHVALAEGERQVV